MSRATEDQLAQLHKRVADTFLSALAQSEEAEHLLAVVRDKPLPTDIVRFLEAMSAVNPSLLTAATKFLKDNSISADPGADEGVGDLKQALDKKRNKNKGNVLTIPFDN